MTLAPAHFKFLRASALNDESIEMMACHSVPPADFARLSPALADCESVLAFPYPGVNAFFRYRLFPPLDKLKYWQPHGSRMHLYLLPSVRAVLSNPNVDIAITEGEKKAACLTQHGILAIGIGGVWNWLIKGTCELLPEFDQVAFIDRNILIIFDSNAWRKEKETIGQAQYALGKAVEMRGGKVECVVIPPADDGNDQGADDFIVKHGIGKFKELKRVKLRHDGLAQFKPWWEQWTKRKAKDAKEIDKLAPRLQPVEPWDQPVDGVALLDEIRATFKRFVVTVQPQAVVVESLWILFAHAIDAFGIAPILAFWSPVPECGKTVNQSIVGKLVPKPLEGSSLTEAVVFRVVEKFKPTVLVDEAADMLTTRPELLSLLRAAHQKNKAFVYRTVGDAHEVTAFSTWAPKSLAITKSKIEDALASRCLIIRMHRKTKNEKTERFSSTNDYPEIEILQRKVARWVQDNFDAIRDAIPQNVPEIDNRSLDNFEPLFKIAHVVGTPWPQLIADAAVKILGGDSPVERSKSIELLADIQLIFAQSEYVDTDRDGHERIWSKDLVEELVSKEQRPWATYNKGKPISQNQVGRLLKDFSIGTHDIWKKDAVGKEQNKKGYYLRHFDDAFGRYIPQGAAISETETLGREVDCNNGDLGQKPEALGGDDLAVGKKDLSTENNKQPSDLAFENSETGGVERSLPADDSDIPDGFTDSQSFDWSNGTQKGDTVDQFWTRVKAEHAARKAKGE
jgi:uncharacterized protein DUF3631/uncharacterized protein DUF3854